ncbi:Bug family tripartite tricarboxylate transporter substrate binding protein [Teichococcus oryzae]|uniref:Tripartite tricarboxylate transporter substrate binding protein n=1 Tax=Teichococcus oryzae TaxID=1608942 RepID=A0A5B2TD55_9PROT|nr:tripartite tricarboxylate transporter substrate binding protein [Pseudoroseomonas oryzae]KAA2212013.1 tripartite tricarboxylate transporter substrate binding protein [Pseudoroseomonas oryzae]
MTIINRRAVLGGLALAPAAPRILRAQGAAGWQPTRPIQLVVGFAPGGGSDVIARTIAEAASPFVPQPMVVVNRPGAGGALAAEQVARALPDGHTLLLAGGSESTSLPAHREVPYDPKKSFRAVIRLTRHPHFICVRGRGGRFSSMGVDVMTRVLLQHVQAHLPGAHFVVENRVGAAGQLGFEAIFRAAPDGYTLGAITTPAANTIAIERQPQYRIADFTFLANVVDDPGGFFVRPDSPWRSLDDLRAAARRQPGELAYGTAGVGSDDHLLGLALEAAADIRLSHIPYNGTPPIITDLIGGRLAIGSLNMGEGFALLKEGRARALAQGGTERWAGTPDVPTFREQGLDVIGGSARGLVGPPGLPAEIRDRLTAAIGAALEGAAFKAEAARLNLPLRPIVGAEY